MLTPLDIQSVTFNRSLRGYNEREVDDFLDRLVIEYEQVYKENLALKEKLAALTAQPMPGAPDGLDPAQAEETVQRIIALGEEVARETRANAEQAAALIIEQAKAQSEKLSRAVREDVQKELTRLEEVRKQAQLFRIQFRTLLETYMQLLDSSAEMGGAGGNEGNREVGAAGFAGMGTPAPAGYQGSIEPSTVSGGTRLTPGEKRALLNIIAPLDSAAGDVAGGGVVGGMASGAAGRADDTMSGKLAEGLKEAAAGLDVAGQAVQDFDDDEQTPTWMEVRK
ncbi:MAG: DivIVA domain-containing protein [Syntrophothermus sp.]